MTRGGVAIVSTVLVVGAVRGSAPAAPYHGVRYLMGTWCELTILDGPSEGVPAAAEAAFQEIARLERVMSTWDAESELSRVNRAAGSGEHSISRDLAEVIAAALRTCHTSEGAFDPTVGPLLRLWGFDSDRPARPPKAAVAAARAQVGCDQVELSVDPPRIRLPDGVSLDLGGIGKGYAVDRALEVLGSRGVVRARLDFGSSSLAFAGRIEGGWPVVLADPRDRDKPLLAFRVERGSISSSGQRERSFVRNGRRYGHIFDPRTGEPVGSPLLLVSVIAPDATRADALSTAAFVMGAEKGIPWVGRLGGVNAIFVEAAPGGHVSVRTTGRIDGLVRLAQ